MPSTIVTKPDVEIDAALLKKLKTQTENEKQVILHVIFQPDKTMLLPLIRIWPTSYLYDHDSDHRSELVHAENITFYPDWHRCETGKDNYFTLIFQGLPKSCTMFDFVEHCNGQFGAFEVLNIPRNKTDVYYVRLAD